MAMKMPKVSDCEALECSYNAEKKCHALAITVSGLKHAVCDTYFKAAPKGGVPDVTGGVGACKEYDCKFNRSLECNAPSIDVGSHMDHADCKTFAPT